MLKEVRVNNLAIIDALELQIPEGLLVISGETGAGKSVLLHALGLLSGNRADRSMIRTGKESLYVEGTFTRPSSQVFHALLEDMDCVIEGETFSISRTIAQNGRSTVRFDGRQISLQDLQRLGPYLIDVYGQNDRNLLDIGRQSTLLDSFLPTAAKETLVSYEKNYARYKQIEQFLKENRPDEQAIERERDLLQYQMDEIMSFDIANTDIDSMLDEHQRALHLEDIQRATSELLMALRSNHDGEGIVEKLERAERVAQQIQQIDGQFPRDAIIECQEILRDYQYTIEAYQNRIDDDPEKLALLNEKVSSWVTLQRKYGQTKDDVLTYYDRLESEYQALEMTAKKIKHGEKELVQLETLLQEEGKLLSQVRRTVAKEIDEKVQQRLSALRMEQAKFEIQVTEETTFNPTGLNRVVFYLQPNPGLAMKPLHEIASGGELSRVMLAIRSVFLENLPSYTVVFDEIDAGVSGHAAQAMAEQLYLLTEHMQIIAVTHMPQLASMGDAHLMITKNTDGQSTASAIQLLSNDERVNELSRMISTSQETESGKRQAETLIESQELWKRGKSWNQKKKS